MLLTQTILDNKIRPKRVADCTHCSYLLSEKEMRIKIHIPSYLQYYSSNLEVVEVNGSTVCSCLDHLVRQFPCFKTVIYTKEGKLVDFIAVHVNGEVSCASELAKPVREGDELSLEFSSGCCF